MKTEASILEKIEKLLNLAREGSGATEEERDTAQKMAQAMLDKYGLKVNRKKYTAGDIELIVVPEATKEQREALARALKSDSFSNYFSIMAEFQARGLDPSEIIPRGNVFTFDAWKALGRSVRKGQKSVHVVTWRPIWKKDGNGKVIEPRQQAGKYPGKAFVFHISQTDPLKPEYTGLLV